MSVLLPAPCSISDERSLAETVLDARHQLAAPRRHIMPRSSDFEIDDVVATFNKGVDAFNKAFMSGTQGIFGRDSFGRPLLDAATQMRSALEYALKLWWVANRPAEVPEDLIESRNLEELIDKRFGDSRPRSKKSEDYHALVRRLGNYAVHKATVPDPDRLRRGIGLVREFIAEDFPMVAERLGRVEISHAGHRDLEDLRLEYFRSLSSELEHIDLRGTALDSRRVPIRLQEVFMVPKIIHRVSTVAVDSALISAASLVSDGPIDLYHVLDESRCVLIGETGSGKSTVCRYLAHSLTGSG